ncbi:haloacid dehalogenase [Methanotorris formicicus]|uniref:Translin n=1 Tax=Methanotorris formicicus Mc-S-70 TaxID=647171 RepID=H1KXN3_9EURY|nr:haloacid dehalogenase [Methanotorris formicicus]EHP88106.1 Translin [Methanotorris formicicus Mc-S-70]
MFNENELSYLIKYFEEKDRLREEILKLSREITKDCALTIRKIHKRKEVSLEEIFEKLRQLNELVKKHVDFEKYASTPQQEFVEAKALYDIIFNNKIPTYKEFEFIKEENYILGLCDVIGELRRALLDAIKDDNKELAEKYFNYMEEIYDFIMKFDHYHVIDNLRRKQDISRSILEKTHGDLINYIENLKLREELRKWKEK